MAITVNFTWTTDHALDVGKQIHKKTVEMTTAGKLLSRDVDAAGPVTSTFVDQASADEFIDFMKQFNFATVDVKEV
jgi:hypothetical protein